MEIRPFQPGDSTAFRELNEEWIAEYFSIEDEDRTILGDPERHVIQPGGHIFMAVEGGQPVGCCALLPLGSGVFELAKMAVMPEYRGRGIGRKILEYAIAHAKTAGAKTLHLESNTKLANAIHLYESLGFHHVPPAHVTPSPYARSNVSMHLHL